MFSSFFPFLRSGMAVSRIMLNGNYVTYVSCAYLSYLANKQNHSLLRNLPKCFVKFMKKTFEKNIAGKTYFRNFPPVCAGSHAVFVSRKRK